MSENERKDTGLPDESDDRSGEFEERLSEALTQGEMETKDPRQAAKEALGYKYEIRIQTEMDPILEETRLFRQIAREVDDRYDKYLEKRKRPPEQK